MPGDGSSTRRGPCVTARQASSSCGSAASARLAESLVLLLNERAIELPDDPALLEELSHLRLRESSPGVVRLDHTSGRHDDQAVPLALACRPLAQDGIVRLAVMASVGVDDLSAVDIDPLGPLDYSMSL